MSKFKDSKVYQKLKHIKKPEKEKVSVKKDNTKKVAMLVWSLIIGIFFISFLSVFVSLSTRSALNDTNRLLSSYEDKQNDEDIPINEADEFLNDFISVFMNIKNEDDYLNERKENLNSFLANKEDLDIEVSSIFNQDDIKGDRILKSQKLISYDSNNDIFQYKVEFDSKVENEIENKVTKGKGKKKKTEVKTEIEEEVESHVLVLNIPVVYEAGKFNVSAVPYFEQVPNLKGDIELEIDDIDLDEINGEDEKEIEEFVINFFEKYASETVEELSYLMEEPVSLNGALDLDEITNLKVYDSDEGYVVTATVHFKDKLNGISQYENVRLEISENGNNYYIDSFEHN